MRTFDYIVKNDLSELEVLNKAVADFFSTEDLPKKVMYAVDLILEEMLSNTILHGYKEQQASEISLRIDQTSDQVIIVIEDDAKAFNPLAVPWQKRSTPAHQRIEEGLGIQFVRNMMNSMEYRREEGKNILEICIDY